MLDRLIFDKFDIFPFVVVFIRDEASVCPRVSDVVVMHEVFKGVYLSLYDVFSRRTGWYCVSRTKIDFSLFQCTRPECHM